MSELPNEIKDIIRRELRMELPVFLEGWVTSERGIEMAELVIQVKPTVMASIGVFGGRSIIAQALALKQLGKGVIVGIDPWKKEAALDSEQDPGNIDWWSKLDIEKIHQGCMQAVWRLGLDEQIVILRASSQNCHSIFGQIDILEIDGNHSEVASCRDVNLYLPHVRSGGWVNFDDSNWSSTQKAIAIMDKHCKLIKDAGTYRVYQKN